MLKDAYPGKDFTAHLLLLTDVMLFLVPNISVSNTFLNTNVSMPMFFSSTFVRNAKLYYIFNATIHCHCFSPIKQEDRFSVNFIPVTCNLLLPSTLYGTQSTNLPQGTYFVTFSITCSLLGKLPGICDHAVGRANPVMTQTVNWLQPDLYPRLSCKVEIVACEKKNLTFSQWID